MQINRSLEVRVLEALVRVRHLKNIHRICIPTDPCHDLNLEMTHSLNPQGPVSEYLA